MKKRNKISAFVVTLLIVLSIFAVAQFPIPVSATPGTKVELSSEALTYPTKEIGNTVVLGLTINHSAAQNVTSWQANFTYDSSVLLCVGTMAPVALPYPQPPGYVPYFLKGMPYQNWSTTFAAGNYATPGAIIGVNGTLTQAGKNATGSGALATLIFQIIGSGSTDVAITDFKLLKPDRSEIPVTTKDGSFSLGAEFELPSISWTYPDKNISDQFVMNLTIKSAELSAWQAGLSFDPDIVNVVSIDFGEGYYLNQTGPITKSAVAWNNTAGTVDAFGVSLLGDIFAPATGSGGAVIATITFKALSYISTSPYTTTIEITDAKAFGSEIPVETEDGKFRLKIGDVNADLNVSGADIVLVLINLGTVPPKPTECDINNDNNVSGADIVLVLINLGGY